MARPRRRDGGIGSGRGQRLSQYHFDAETYLSSIVGEIPHFDAFQDAVAQATAKPPGSEYLTHHQAQGYLHRSPEP